MVITVPVLLWQLWSYVAPGLHKNEKQFFLPIFLCSPILYLIGAAFAFYILFPFVFKFFLDMNESGQLPVVLLPAMTGYLSFAIGLLKVFGLAFQLPLILIGLNKIGLLSRKTAIKSRRYVIIGFFVLAAMLTPPDVISQIVLALPMWLLFEISILFMHQDV
jgi:sec-independent protein translocase protein TatC